MKEGIHQRGMKSIFREKGPPQNFETAPFFRVPDGENSHTCHSHGLPVTYDTFPFFYYNSLEISSRL